MNHVTIEEITARIADAHREAELVRASRSRVTRRHRGRRVRTATPPR